MIAMKQTCSICDEQAGLLFWSPTLNSYYCAGCYQGSEHEVKDSELHILESLSVLRKEHNRLRATHSRLVLASWDVLGEERMLEILGGSNWKVHLRRTLEQIRSRPEAA